MYIRDIYKNSQVITEAARFGNKEIRELLPQLGRFKFGCEYEFNVHKGVPFLDKFIDAEDPMDHPLISRYFNQIDSLAKGIAKINKFGGIENIEGYLSDIEDAINGEFDDDPDSMDYFTGTTLPEVAELSKLFITNIERPSQELMKHFSFKGMYGYGMLTNSVSQSESRAMRAIGSMYSFNDPSLEIMNAANLAMAGVHNYLKKDAQNFPSETYISSDVIADTFMGVLHKIYIERAKGPSKVEIVERDLPINRQFIEDVKPDVTVPDGVEVITKPISARDTFRVMKEMFDYISEVGYTDNKTGLHINISIDGVDMRKVNYVKMMTLIDIEFYQGLSRSGKNFIKYPVRSDWVTPNTQVLSARNISGVSNVERLASAYIRDGAKGLISLYEDIIVDDNQKERAVNLMHVFNADATARRVEFRLFGVNDSHGYEQRLEEIYQDVMQICYMLLASCDDKFLQKEYMQGIIRFLDRAVSRMEFDGQRFASFSSLVNNMRNR